MRRTFAVLAAVLLIGAMAVPRGEAASGFATAAIQGEWMRGESALLNFYGPLRTARDRMEEPYRDAPWGKRFVQYFDKARLETADFDSRAVTSGLLTVEMVTGRVQMGDAAFETRTPARVPVAGDPDNAGPTYADMARLPEFRPRPAGGVGLPALLYRNGNFTDVSRTADADFIVVKRTPDAPAATYVGDAGMRYGAFVFQPFHEYIEALPGGTSLVGYPIRPYFMADVKIGGVAKRVVVQAFERRVLTYNPANPESSRVEFGNIGQHYHRWRYEGGMGISSGDRATATAAMATANAGIATQAAQIGATATAGYLTGRTVVAELTQIAGTANARATTARP